MAENKKKIKKPLEGKKVTPMAVVKKMVEKKQVFDHKVKKLEIYVELGGNHLYRVRYNKGGSIPASLDQAFTSQSKAQKAIDRLGTPFWDSTVKVK